MSMSLIKVWVLDYLKNVLFRKTTANNEFSVSKGNCEGYTLLSAKTKLKIPLFSLNQQSTRLKLCFCKLKIVSNILKSKEFTDQDL